MILLLDHVPGMVVAGITDRLPCLVTQLEAAQPDVLLLEWELTFESMAELLTKIRNLSCPPKVIVLSQKAEEEKKIVAVGADYFIVTNTPPDELLLILKNICDPKPI